MHGNPFQLDASSDSRIGSLATAIARPLLSWLLDLPTYRALYARAQTLPSDIPFASRALQSLNIPIRCSQGDLTSVPRSGPLLVAANHPHGALDGLLLAAALRTVRSDVRVLTNHLLARIPELSELCYFVDPFGGRDAAARSRSGLRAAHLWLRRGGTLVVFPAGEVAHTLRHAGAYSDSEWQPTVGRLVQATRAQVVPAHIEGSNSAIFYAAGRLHPSLRTALLARELLKQRGRRATVRFGAPLAAASLAHDDDPLTITRSIRRAVDRLAVPLARASDDMTSRIAFEIEQLPAESRLLESGAFQVFVARADQIPTALKEIGRLREISYRMVGEGTGREIDLDRFDEHYLHLFSWNREVRQIVGAYRIGQTDRIMATAGVDGLYTRTLFAYDDRLVAKLSPALELGRSFVRPEYQKNYSALLLLWKGIGQFVVRHPEYRVLFGPVSISARYSDRSQQLLMAFLQQNHLDRDLADLVHALNPSALNPAPDAVPASVDDANRMIAAAEDGAAGVPILLRQYLKLNARLLGFNVDPSFGDALDALMMVDLAAVEPAILNRYLGREETRRFLARHLTTVPAHAA